MEKALPAIPAKRYFTIGEVSELCGVKPYVLRYWEQEFAQLKPMKRRGNRRYYQHHEVLLIRRIRELLYDHGFTISGARNRLAEHASHRGAADGPDRAPAVNRRRGSAPSAPEAVDAATPFDGPGQPPDDAATSAIDLAAHPAVGDPATDAPIAGAAQLRAELLSIRALLAP